MSDITVVDALRTRRSIRAFLPTPVEADMVAAILRIAARSPSASNMQPWRVHACSGAVRQALSEDLVRAHAGCGGDHAEEYRYYPGEWADPYLARRRKVGKDLYGLLGIPKGDSTRMQRQYARNYEFFDAPVGLFFTVSRQLVSGHAAWMDLGAFVHAAMLAARSYGLDTCAQQAFARYHRIVRRHLPLTDDEILVCGMSLGYADPDHPANRLETAREPVESFASFTGFPPAPDPEPREAAPSRPTR
ncbi:nitroreductase [Achromobacter denitrificans]